MLKKLMFCSIISGQRRGSRDKRASYNTCSEVWTPHYSRLQPNSSAVVALSERHHKMLGRPSPKLSLLGLSMTFNQGSFQYLKTIGEPRISANLKWTRVRVIQKPDTVSSLKFRTAALEVIERCNRSPIVEAEWNCSSVLCALFANSMPPGGMQEG